jgi:hypothetical protein
MMKKILLVIIFYFFLLSCGDTNGTKKQDEKNSKRVNSVTKKPVTDTNAISINTSIRAQKPSTDLATRIIGTWALIGSENASFDIEKKEINYPETFTSYKYSLVNDSIRIKYDNYTGNYLIRMRGSDTLVLIGDEEQVYFRFKE